jgi:uncharacterized protein YndB with AHSA1/START domain
MDDRTTGQPAADERTAVTRTAEQEVTVTRLFDAPPAAVFEAWAKPELFRRWWAPASMGAPLLSCEMDVRPGGGYRLEFGVEGAEPWPFFGRYLEVVPGARLVWTNEEGGGEAVTTVTFEPDGQQTRLVLRETHPSAAAAEEAVQGMCEMTPEQFRQLDALLAGSTRA